MGEEVPVRIPMIISTTIPTLEVVPIPVTIPIPIFEVGEEVPGRPKRGGEGDLSAGACKTQSEPSGK